MPAKSNAQRLVVVPDTEDFSSELHASSAEPAACSFCFGTGMEVMAGKGARRGLAYLFKKCCMSYA